MQVTDASEITYVNVWLANRNLVQTVMAGQKI